MSEFTINRVSRDDATTFDNNCNTAHALYAEMRNRELIIYFRGTVGNDRVVHEMRRGDVDKLHESIRDDWDDWVTSATASDVAGWNNSSFLLDNVPITIAVRYGQNQPICQHGVESHQEEAAHWHRLHSYHHMRQITFALATHVQ